MQLVPLTWHRTLGTINDEGGGGAGGGEEVAVANTKLVRIPRRTLPEPAAIQLYLARFVVRKDGSPVRNRVAMSYLCKLWHYSSSSMSKGKGNVEAEGFKVAEKVSRLEGFAGSRTRHARVKLGSQTPHRGRSRSTGN